MQFVLGPCSSGLARRHWQGNRDEILFEIEKRLILGGDENVGVFCTVMGLEVDRVRRSRQEIARDLGNDLLTLGRAVRSLGEFLEQLEPPVLGEPVVMTAETKNGYAIPERGPARERC